MEIKRKDRFHAWDGLVNVSGASPCQSPFPQGNSGPELHGGDLSFKEILDKDHHSWQLSETGAEDDIQIFYWILVRKQPRGLLTIVCVCVRTRKRMCMFSHSVMFDSLQPHEL